MCVFSTLYLCCLLLTIDGRIDTVTLLLFPEGVMALGVLSQGPVSVALLVFLFCAMDGL